MVLPFEFCAPYFLLTNFFQIQHNSWLDVRWKEVGCCSWCRVAGTESNHDPWRGWVGYSVGVEVGLALRRWWVKSCGGGWRAEEGVEVRQTPF